MDPVSIALACGSVLKTIFGVTQSLTQIIKDFRGARSELATVRNEINGLQTVIELIEHDTGSNEDEDSKDDFPEALVAHLKNILGNCDDVLKDLERLLAKHFSARVGPGSTWVVSGKDDVAKLRATLAAHTAALNLALNLVEVSLARKIDATTQRIEQQGDTLGQQNDEIKGDTEEILARIAELRALLPDHKDKENLMLGRYLDSLTLYAESVAGDSNVVSSDIETHIKDEALLDQHESQEGRQTSKKGKERYVESSQPTSPLETLEFRESIDGEEAHVMVSSPFRSRGWYDSDSDAENMEPKESEKEQEEEEEPSSFSRDPKISTSNAKSRFGIYTGAMTPIGPRLLKLAYDFAQAEGKVSSRSSTLPITPTPNTSQLTSSPSCTLQWERKLEHHGSQLHVHPRLGIITVLRTNTNSCKLCFFDPHTGVDRARSNRTIALPNEWSKRLKSLDPTINHPQWRLVISTGENAVLELFPPGNTNLNIWGIHLDLYNASQKKVEILPGIYWDLSLTPDGTQLIFLKYERKDLCISCSDLHSSNHRNITDATESISYATHPSKPIVAYTTKSGIKIADISSQTIIKVPFLLVKSTELGHTKPQFSPDGKYVALIPTDSGRYRSASSIYRVYIGHYDTVAQLRQLSLKSSLAVEEYTLPALYVPKPNLISWSKASSDGQCTIVMRQTHGEDKQFGRQKFGFVACTLPSTTEYVGNRFENRLPWKLTEENLIRFNVSTTKGKLRRDWGCGGVQITKRRKKYIDVIALLNTWDLAGDGHRRDEETYLKSFRLTF